MEARAVKLLVNVGELADLLGLPEGAQIVRLEIDNVGLEQALELVLTGPDFPPAPPHAELCRFRRPDLDEMMERAKATVYERHAQGLSTKLIADGEVIGEIPAPTALVGWIGGTVIVRADAPIREDRDVTTGPDGGVVEWRDGDPGKPLGRSLSRAYVAGDEVKVEGFGSE